METFMKGRFGGGGGGRGDFTIISSLSQNCQVQAFRKHLKIIFSQNLQKIIFNICCLSDDIQVITLLLTF